MKRLWCRIIHRGATIPIRGKYMCPTCLEEYPCPWEIQKTVDEPAERVQSLKEGETAA